MLKRIFFGTVLTLSWLLTGCGTSSSQATYTNILVPEYQEFQNRSDATFVNVHIPFEGDIPGTDASIPFNEIEQNLDLLPQDKDALLVIYCRSGNMSRTASETLVELGYTNVYNLEGGMIAWQEAGLSLEGQ